MNHPKLMPLADWAEMRYSRPPSIQVLRRLCRLGQFDPPAEKTGRDWYVQADARLICANDEATGDPQPIEAPAARRLTLVEQLKRAGL